MDLRVTISDCNSHLSTIDCKREAQCEMELEWFEKYLGHYKWC